MTVLSNVYQYNFGRPANNQRTIEAFLQFVRKRNDRNSLVITVYYAVKTVQVYIYSRQKMKRRVYGTKFKNERALQGLELVAGVITLCKQLCLHKIIYSYLYFNHKTT